MSGLCPFSMPPVQNPIQSSEHSEAKLKFMARHPATEKLFSIKYENRHRHWCLNKMTERIVLHQWTTENLKKTQKNQ